MIEKSNAVSNASEELFDLTSTFADFTTNLAKLDKTEQKNHENTVVNDLIDDVNHLLQKLCREQNYDKAQLIRNLVKSKLDAQFSCKTVLNSSFQQMPGYLFATFPHVVDLSPNFDKKLYKIPTTDGILTEIGYKIKGIVNFEGGVEKTGDALANLVQKILG